AVAGRLVDAEAHGLLADGLAETKLSIDDSEGVVLEDDLDVAIGQHAPVAQPLNIRGHPNEPVRVVSRECGLDQVRGAALGLGRIAACRLEEGTAKLAQAVVSEPHDPARTTFWNV